MISGEIKEDGVKRKGYLIYGREVFVNVVKRGNSNGNVNSELKGIFDCIESCGKGYGWEKKMKGLFGDFDRRSRRVGNRVENKKSGLGGVLKGVGGLNLGRFGEDEIELLGDG